MFTGKTIFYGALDWGLGHATRSVPIIRELLKNNTVILGVTPSIKAVFDEEFPDLKTIELPAYNVTYSRVFPIWIKLILKYPEIAAVIKQEHHLLEKIIKENDIDVVVSDNRFGLYSGSAYSVFITHQLFLKAPLFEDLGKKINQKYISNFHEVWVPDHEQEEKSLSGELSHGSHFHENVKYIGPQSRLKDVICNIEKDEYDILILLSGAEPTRTILEKSLLNKMRSSNKKIALVRGCEFQVSGLKLKNIDVFDLPPKEKLKELILSSHQIMCRSGYSTLMDLHVLEKKDLILIPTPGQTEQEYLAEYWKKKFGARVVKQNEINKLINFAS